MQQNITKNLSRASSNREIKRKLMETQENTSSILILSRPRAPDTRTRSPSLQKQEKYPPLLKPIRVNSGIQRESKISQKSDVIQEKSEVEEDQNLQEMIQEIAESYTNTRSLSDKASKQQVHFDALINRPSNLRFQAPSPIMQSQTKESQMQQQEQMYVYDTNEERAIIQKSAIFWKREQFNENDLKDFQQIIKNYILIRARPVPLNQLGEKLLKNGYFVMAYIKYMTSNNVDSQVRDILFNMFKNQYEVQVNQEQFNQAYSNNFKDSNRGNSQNSTPEIIESKQQSNFFRPSRRSSNSDVKNQSVRNKPSLRRKYSDEFQIKDVFPRSRQKYIRKEYKNVEYMKVKSVISSALGKLREFVIVRTENKCHDSPQFVLIPKKKGQMVNMSSLNEALKQSQQITQSNNIYYFPVPGPQFDQIYVTLNSSSAE